MGIYSSYTAGIDFNAISETMQPVTNATFNARIQLIDPNIGDGTYDRKTNTVTGRERSVIWTGPARIQAMRWPNVASPRGEATSLRTVVFHIPLNAELAVAFVPEGWRIRVLDGGMSPEFENGLFVITSSVNTSYAWDHRIETVQDQGAEVVY